MAREKKKKSLAFKIIVTILIILLVLAIAIGIYVFSKVNSLSNAIHNPLDRDKSELRKKAVGDGDPVSVVIYGIDEDSERKGQNLGQRTDSIIMMSINPKDHKTVMVSIPRDTRAKIVGRGTTEKINHAYAYGGPDMAVKSLEKLTNVPVDHYAAINMDGVKTVVDQLGGVDVTSNATFKFHGYQFNKGQKYHMNGDKALTYMRSREQEGAGGDSGRQLRQQQVIEAVAKEGLQVGSITKIDGIFKAAEDNVKTDLSLTQLNKMRQNYDDAQDNVERETIQGENKVGNDNLWYFYPDENNLNSVMKKYKENLDL
ncbi:LCP family protein [Staphylococcus capitis]|uniref:LCP family glycopolymer transferase n=1 Tax=Staphylococcus capitis TaxID=29388 RepID=UPI001D14DDC1|nr:LCP family protein [Staphylococcus capitis]MCC3756079.1 LCP family protein [Staphylococcus capitis]MDH8729180.1 LCP family protein [Staphylococcus capitis]MDH8921364.1 LCP family protein [Staphylococcus capitis]MDH8942567.1 LCP family protein [Staphylococcus capitis]MDH9592340.1 LCP family protein [Staphylococcus capitis]